MRTDLDKEEGSRFERKTMTIRPERGISFICSRALSMEVESQYSYMCGLKELIRKAVGEESGEEKHLQVLRKTEAFMSQEVAKLRSKPNRATKYISYMRRLISGIKLMLNFLEDREEETNAYPTLGVIITHFINIMLTSSMKERGLSPQIAAQSYSFVKMIFDNDVEYVLDVVLCSNIADDASAASKSVGYHILVEVVRDHKLFQENSAVFAKFCAAAHLLRDSHHAGKALVEGFYNEVTHFPSDLEEHLKTNYGFKKEKARFSVSVAIEKIEPRKVILASRNKRLIVVPFKNRLKPLARKTTKLVMSASNHSSTLSAASSENFFYDVKGDYLDCHATENSAFENPVLTSEEDGSDQGEFQCLQPIYPLENMIQHNADSDGESYADGALGSHYSRVESSDGDGDGNERHYPEPQSGDDDIKDDYVDYHDSEIEVTSTFENPVGTKEEDGCEQDGRQCLQPIDSVQNMIPANADSDADSSVVTVGSIRRGVGSSDDGSERNFAEPESGDDEVPCYDEEDYVYPAASSFEDVHTSENNNGPIEYKNAPGENNNGPAENINGMAENNDGPAGNNTEPAENNNEPAVVEQETVVAKSTGKRSPRVQLVKLKSSTLPSPPKRIMSNPDKSPENCKKRGMTQLKGISVQKDLSKKQLADRPPYQTRARTSNKRQQQDESSPEGPTVKSSRRTRQTLSKNN